MMEKYRKTALWHYAAAAILVAIWVLLSGCSATSKQLFNEYQAAHLYETRPTDKSIDVLITVRIRGFGNREEKRAAWCAAWPDFCKPELPAAGMSVSSKTPEIWVDLREHKGGIVINDVILGHEMRHILKLQDGRVHDPDR